MKKPTFRVYRSKDGWRWRLESRNGRILADSGEAYSRRRDCRRALASVWLAIFDADLEGAS